MYNIQDALYAPSILGIKFDKFSPKEFLDGINIELEHGTINPKTNKVIEGQTYPTNFIEYLEIYS